MYGLKIDQKRQFFPKVILHGTLAVMYILSNITFNVWYMMLFHETNAFVTLSLALNQFP